jgi:hypothetical protein
MKQIAAEREATINQFMNELSAERKDVFKDFITEEHRMRGLLTELRQTLAAGNELAVSAGALVERLNLGQGGPSEASSPSEPFAIKDYQETLVEASSVVQQLDGLINSFDQVILSAGWEQALPRLVNALDLIGSKGDERMNHAFKLGLVFILVFLVGWFFVLLGYRYVAYRVLGWGPKISGNGV